jgi:hypothetical protein
MRFPPSLPDMEHEVSQEAWKIEDDRQARALYPEAFKHLDAMKAGRITKG